ncbi:hypothetical protein D3C72_2470160 [compost metagenome]
MALLKLYGATPGGEEKLATHAQYGTQRAQLRGGGNGVYFKLMGVLASYAQQLPNLGK